MKIESSVTLQDFKVGHGCYVWVDPTPRSLLKIFSLMEHYPEKWLNGTELHVTVIYSKELPILNDIVIDDISTTGWITGLSLWKDHKQRDILVANIKSKSLLALHNTLRRTGLVHSYADFNPHMTLSYEVNNVGVVQSWIEEVEPRFPMPIYFESSLKAAPAS